MFCLNPETVDARIDGILIKVSKFQKKSIVTSISEPCAQSCDHLETLRGFNKNLIYEMKEF